MKKHSMWIILGAILLVEIITYLAFVSPRGTVIADKVRKLKRTTKALRDYADMGGKIPTRQVNKLHKKNRRTLKDEHDSCVEFFKDEDRRFKQWFEELGIKDWERQPTPAQFQSRYRDQFNKLRKFCEDNGISVSDEVATLLVELKSGEKLKGTLLREDDTEIVIQVAGKETILAQTEVKRKVWVALKLTSEEQATVQNYMRFAPPPQVDTDETVPDNAAGGFWETSKLNAKNLRTAQMQFWVQKAFVEALKEANGKQLVFASFYKERDVRRGRKEEERKPQTAIEAHFERMPVTMLVKMPYGSIATMLQYLNAKCPVNMEFKSLRVVKPLLSTISTSPHPLVKLGVTYTQQDAFNGVMPKVFSKHGGVYFGEVVRDQKRNLPDQDQLISEPPVLVEFSYYVMMKIEPKPAAKKP